MYSNRNTNFLVPEVQFLLQVTMQNLLTFLGKKKKLHVVAEDKTSKIIENIPHLLSNPLIFSVIEIEGLNPSGLGLSGSQILHQKYCYLHNNTSNNQTVVILFQCQASSMPKVTVNSFPFIAFSVTCNREQCSQS